MRYLKFLYIFSLFSCCSHANNIVNVYAWGGEIPAEVIRAFSLETGITVNFSTYDNNETMYAKLRASQNNIYDVILPSGYFVERMQKQNLLTALDKTKLPNLSNIAPRFIKNAYDFECNYSIPLIWGATGIVYNKHWIKQPPKHWEDLWNKRFHRQLMLLDDSREIFSLALISLGYDANDKNPQHIKTAYQKLLTIKDNIKLFASDGIQATLIDEDANIGTAWNGDAYKAHSENGQINFIYPQEGFVLWVDCLSIPRHPPHLENAYKFINFMLKPQIAKIIALQEGHAITNQAGIKLLPANIRNNQMAYPSDDILRNSYFQRDVGEKTIALYNQYWQLLKLAI